MNACTALASWRMSYTTRPRNFRMDFERAQLAGNKTRSGKQEMSDGVAIAKVRINKALEALGRGKDGPNTLQSWAWNVVRGGAYVGRISLAALAAT